jgi:hypothetical protein
MNEQSEAGGEGSPAVERAEKQVLGTDTYQKAEVIHRFADTHPWFHPLLLGGFAILVLCVGLFLYKHFAKKHD